MLSYKPNDDMLLYASYSRGYKAGGFNLDRSALKIPIFTFASQGGAQALVSRLQFDPETVDAFEIGGKYSAGGILFNFALFRQEFKNFQLNTFDGTVFIVQNINGCDEDLAGLDEDQSKFSTAPNFNPMPPPAAPATPATSATASVRRASRSRRRRAPPRTSGSMPASPMPTRAIAGTSSERTMGRRSTRRFAGFRAAACRTLRRRSSPDRCPGPRRSVEAA